jgi:site-specific DNA recombinase
MTEQKAVAYIRVSSGGQEDNTSLAGQEQDIKDFCKKKNWTLTNIYRDVASGEFTEKRASMLRLLADAEDHKFDVVVCVNNDRFGRNLREQKENVEALIDLNIQLWWVWENRQYDEWDTLGDDIKGAVSESERKKIIQRTLKARLENARKGIPHQRFNIGFNRQYLKDENKWQWINPEVTEIVQWAANQFLSGRGIYDIAKEIRGQNIIWFTAPRNDKKKGWVKGQPVYFVPAESYLRRVLKDHCGPDIIETFNSKNFRRIFGKESETIIYHTGLSILDKATTQRIHDKLALRDKVNRKGGRKNKYLLTGFIRCQKCNYPVNGHTTDAGHSTYRHIQKRPAVNKEYPHCFGGGIKTQDLDNAVMSTIFENIMDVKGFEKAIAESLPDSKDMKALQHRIKRDESKLLNVKKQLSRLVDMALAGTLSDKTIKEKEAEILQAKEALEKSVIEDRTALQSMESSKGLEEQAEAVRRNLKQYFGSKDRLNEMSFDEKRELLSFLFTGKDQSGTNYAIYIEPNPDGSWDYFLYGRLIVGLRTVKGDDIDYDPESGQNNNPGNKVIKLDIFKKSASQLAAG